MNYGIIGSVSQQKEKTKYNSRNSMVKQFLSQNRRVIVSRNTYHNQEYIDKMLKNLNVCVQENIQPHWRNHQSLKGWTSMNYPTVLQNPLLKKLDHNKTVDQSTDQIQFSNIKRPITGFQISDSFKRPFSTKTGSEKLIKVRKDNQLKAIKNDFTNMSENEVIELFEKKQQDKNLDKGLPHVHSMDQLSLVSGFMHGKSIQTDIKKVVNDNNYSKQTLHQIKSVDTLKAFSAFPQKAVKKDKKKLEEEKKAKEEEEERLRAIPKVMSTIEALQKSQSWLTSINIKNKLSVGTTATTKYHDKVKIFKKFNNEEKSNILPLDNYFGGKPNPSKDKFDRIKTIQLNDISFDEESEDDFEDANNLKRQPKTILSEDNLKKYLNDDIVKLNLEHHYWLKDAFLSKIGRMAQNIKVLSLRRLKISDESFFAIFKSLKQVETLDISDCPLICQNGFSKFLDSCGSCIINIQASSCQNAIDNTTLLKLANIENLKLEFLDISYSKQVTDEGLKAFENKNIPISHLCMNGLSSATGLGLSYPIQSCKKTLTIYEGALMEHEEIKSPELGKALGVCFKLEVLDVAGCNHLSDEFFNNLCSGEGRDVNDMIIKPGLSFLNTVKINFLKTITDSSVMKICQMSSILQNLEMPGCELITDYCIENIFKTFKNIQFIDINHIPAVNPAFFDILKATRPEMLIRRYQNTQVDPKDNMLRVPLRIIQKKKKGGKKKKKKK